MARVTLTHDIACDVDAFWKLFFDKEFNETLYRERLGFSEFELLETRETDANIFRRAKGQPKMNAPAVVQKFFGANFRYTEDGTFDKATKTFRWVMTPSVLQGKLTQDGSVRTEAIGTDKTRRIVELIIEAKVFGVGSIIEGTAEKQIRDGWDKSAIYMNEWIAKHR